MLDTRDLDETSITMDFQTKMIQDLEKQYNTQVKHKILKYNSGSKYYNFTWNGIIESMIAVKIFSNKNKNNNSPLVAHFESKVVKKTTFAQRFWRGTKLFSLSMIVFSLQLLTRPCYNEKQKEFRIILLLGSLILFSISFALEKWSNNIGKIELES